MLHVRLQSEIPEELVRQNCAGRLCSDEDVGLVANQSCAVYKPNGHLLLKLIRGAVPESIRASSWGPLLTLKSVSTDNRGVYTAAKRVGTEFADGRKSKNTRARDEEGKIIKTSSAVIGYFDRQGGRFPFCRATAFTANEVEGWQGVLPLTRFADEQFREHLPQRHAAQREFCRGVRPEWVIEDTAFTTVTVNNTVVAGVHKDKGDYSPGFGIITCFREGAYTGGLLCFPKHKVAVDLQDRDLLFFDPHEWHGMTPIVGGSEPHDRVTCVFYAREKMQLCGSLEEEIARGRRVRGAL